MNTRTNQDNDGRPFQTRMEKVCLQYESRGIARIKKIDPPVRVLGGGQRRKVIFKKNPFLDFMGTWHAAGGRSLCIEIKSTSEERLPFGGSGGVTVNQLENLREWTVAGAIAFVLWEFKPTQEVSIIRWQDFAFRLRTSPKRKSFGWDEVPRVPGSEEKFIPFDFLTAARERWNNDAIIGKIL